MARQRELRDPIHGFVQRSELEEQLIDTCVFQRLRGIRQLAMACFVYPGALHTRFDHSIGVMHVAGRLASRLLADDSETQRIIRIAALLHDIGHGPFSHVSEDILDRYYDKEKVKPKAKEKIHETLTCEIIEKNVEIEEHVSLSDRTKAIRLLLGTGGESIAHSIISGPLDADKQDYLLRDSYFCGVKYGVFDMERLIGTLAAHQDGHDRILAASSDGVYAIEQYVMAKYHMTTQVYRHKVRLVSDSMIVRALELGIETDKLDWLRKLYIYDGTDSYIGNFLEWDDARLMDSLLHQDGGLASEVFKRLRQRKLFKVVFTRPLRDFEDPQVRESLSSSEKNPELRRKLEREIADYLSTKMGTDIKPYHVIVKPFTIKSVREQSRNSEGSIIILTGGGPRNFEDESTLFRSIDERESDQYVEVYAPVAFSDEVDKRKKKAEFSTEIMGILNGAIAREPMDREMEGETSDGRTMGT